ncbi:hypothetical protein ACPYO6_14065 [Georgenia sp. Z1344]|uniref:hypothetical protein n=1 Tax=Georgenia sp. Z1344 TaxID=3416706 RepID=UPI003CFA6087
MASTSRIRALVTIPALALLLAACGEGTDDGALEDDGANESEAGSEETASDESPSDDADPGTEPGSTDAAGLRVAVATNEPWGAYHVEHVADEIEAQGGTIELIVPDMSEVDEEAAVASVPLDDADPADYDLLVVNGAEEWPAEVVEAFEDLPVVASSTAYLEAEEAPFADDIRPRLTAVTASSPAEQETFAVYLGVDEEDIEVVGVPELDETPEWEPEPDTVLILTSVTYPDETGGAAPSAELLLDTAHALSDEGYEILVGMHPREDASLWEEFEIAEEGSVEAAARAEVAVGIPGSVFPKIAAIGTPLVGTVDAELEVPEYLTTTGAMVDTVEDALAAVEDAEPLTGDELEFVVGPLGQAGPDLVDAWAEGSRLTPEDADL